MRRLAYVVVAAAACGGGGESQHPDGAAPPDALTSAQAVADLARAECMKRDACSNDFGNVHVYGSEPICETRSAIPLLNGLVAPGTGQTAAHHEACAQIFATSYTCAAFFDDEPPAACTIPMGAEAQGTACSAGAQCASTFCAVTATTVCGTCQPLPVVGATCHIAADCGRDLACATPAGSASGTCAAFVSSGGACLTGTNPCAADLACVGDDPTTSTPGVCMAAGATIGAECDGARATLASCDGELGLVCVPDVKGSTIGTCQMIGLVGSGEPCGQLGAAPITGFNDCTAGGFCVKAAPTDKTGVCAAPVADGSACDSVLGPPCLDPAKCVGSGSGSSTAGICTLPDATLCH